MTNQELFAKAQQAGWTEFANDHYMPYNPATTVVASANIVDHCRYIAAEQGLDEDDIADQAADHFFGMSGICHFFDADGNPLEIYEVGDLLDYDELYYIAAVDGVMKEGMTSVTNNLLLGDDYEAVIYRLYK